MRTAANADSNSYYRIHWPEMRIQEVVDTINKLRRESTPDYKSVDGQARKDGLDSRFARLLEVCESCIHIGMLSCKSGQNRRCPADSELLMPR